MWYGNSYQKGDKKINTKTHVDVITLVVESNDDVIELIKCVKTDVKWWIRIWTYREQQKWALSKNINILSEGEDTRRVTNYNFLVVLTTNDSPPMKIPRKE